MKYNPAFLSEQDLRANFVVRQAELALVLEALRDDTEGASQHQLIIGPRGSGKSTLVQRIVAELRSDLELSARYLPVVFGEESYEVDSAGALWLDALDHLARQADVASLREAHEKLRRERDPDRLRQLCLAELDDFADARRCRLVLFVENVQTLLTEQIGRDEAWTLRHTLLNDRRIVLLATATTRFAAIDAPDQAMYELFRVVPLEPLTSTECAVVWTHLTGQSADERQGRALEILTGGNLRLLTILSGFGTSTSLASMLENLTGLIDEHTEFFRSNIESLPAGERRVFVALADHWAPATASELADLLRTEVNLVSAQLARLEQRGVVSSTGSARRKCYQLTERLYNIYYLLRRHGRAAERVQVVVDFIAAYYSPDALVDHLLGFAEHALHAPSDQIRELYLQAFYRLYNRLADTHAPAIIRRLPADFVEKLKLPAELREDIARRAEDARHAGKQVQMLTRRLRGALTLLDALEREMPEIPCIEDLTARFLAMARGDAVGPLEFSADDKTALQHELQEIRDACVRACGTIVARDVVSNLDLVCAATLSILSGAPKLTRQAFERLIAPFADHPYAQLLSLLIAWAADNLSPVRFAARCELLVRNHPHCVFLPVAAGLLVLGVGLQERGLDLIRGTPLTARFVPVAAALADIYQDIRDEEPNIMLEPRATPLVPLLKGDAWESLFAGLAFLADPLAQRPGDALEILRHGQTVAPDNFLLQAQVAWRLHHRMHRFDESHDAIRAAAAVFRNDWRDHLLMALLHIDPRRNLRAAIPEFVDSWRKFLATQPTPGELTTSVTLWLAPGNWRLIGHQVPMLFLAALKQPAEISEALFAEPPSAEFRHVVMSLCMRGEGRQLLDRLRRQQSHHATEIIAAGVALFLGEVPSVPREVAEVAQDIAFELRWARTLYGLVTRGEPPEEPALTASMQPRILRRSR